MRVFLGHFRITPTDELRRHIYKVQVDTTVGGKLWSASGIIIAELTEALRELGYELPNPRLSRKSQGYILRPEEFKGWDKPVHPRFRRLECSAGKECCAALLDRMKQYEGRAFTEMVHDLLMSRVGKLPPAYLHKGRTYTPERIRERVARPAEHRDFNALFLQLCKERAAFDKWHRKGGQRPTCTVDDHLGRRRGVFDPDKVASDKNSYLRSK